MAKKNAPETVDTGVDSDAQPEDNYIDINIDDVKDPNEPAAEGEARIRFVKSEKTRSKAGEAMIKAEAEIVSHEDPEAIGKRVFPSFMLEGKGKRFGEFEWAKLNRILGLDGRNASAIVGLEIDVYIIVEPGSGQYGPSNRVKDYLNA